jgi:hypothetical protein
MCSENRRKGVIYYFQIKINMYAVISHLIPFIIFRDENISVYRGYNAFTLFRNL